MDVKDFVAETLKQITEGTKAASTTDQRFYLDNYSSKGVHFNLAVANTETSTKGSGSKANVNLLKVVSAGGEKGQKSTVSSETVSRVEFNITYHTPASSGSVKPRPPQVKMHV
jgi:hypothetical protein